MGNKFLFVGLVLFISCNKIYSPVEYINWMEDKQNGLVQTKNIAGVQFKAFYRTVEYNMLKELGPGNIKNAEKVNEYKSSNGELQFYELILSKDSLDFIQQQSSTIDDYHKQLYYFTFSFQNDIKMIYPGFDTLSPILYHFERAYSLSNKKKIILAFPFSKHNGDRCLQIDSPLLPTGVVNLFFLEKDITKASEIKIIE